MEESSERAPGYGDAARRYTAERELGKLTAEILRTMPTGGETRDRMLSRFEALSAMARKARELGLLDAPDASKCALCEYNRGELSATWDGGQGLVCPGCFDRGMGKVRLLGQVAPPPETDREGDLARDHADDFRRQFHRETEERADRDRGYQW